MKKQFTFAGFFLLVSLAILITAASTQQGKEKNNNGQSQKQDKGNGSAGQGKPGKSGGAPENRPGNQGKKDKTVSKGNNSDNGNGNAKGNGKGNKNDFDNPGNKNGKNVNAGRGNNDMRDGYFWNQETFRDRRKYKNQDKVSICHKFSGNNNEPAVTINVSANALKAHMNHGDVMGSCPSVNDGRFSDLFLRNRNDYYGNIQNHYEQVSYSRSILDYALARLTNSRQQLVNMQNSGMPIAEIESRQASVVQLEQNVSLLETLIGVATTIVVDKLQ